MCAMYAVFDPIPHEYHNYAIRTRTQVRNLGLMGAIQLDPPSGWEPGKLGAAVMNHAWQHEDLYIRFTGDIIAFSPAFVATKDEITRIFEGTKNALNAVLQQ